MRRSMFIGLAAVALCLVAAACTKVTPSDAGPPVLTWSVHNNGTGTTQQITGSGTIQAKLADSFTVTFKADSPGGVHKVTLGGSASWSCRAGDVGQSRTADQKTDVQTDSPDSQGQVLTTLFLIRDAYTNLDCESGFSFSGGGSEMDGTGENYFGKVASAKLAFNVSA